MELCVASHPKSYQLSKIIFYLQYSLVDPNYRWQMLRVRRAITCDLVITKIKDVQVVIIILTGGERCVLDWKVINWSLDSGLDFCFDWMLQSFARLWILVHPFRKLALQSTNLKEDWGRFAHSEQMFKNNNTCYNKEETTYLVEFQLENFHTLIFQTI